MKDANRYNTLTARYQTGVMTTFTGVMILVLLTLMMFFAIRVGVFEQRVSSNEMRQKLAFHAAESGIHHAKEYLRKHSFLVASSVVDKLPNGADGWLADTAEKRWQKCPDSIPLDEYGKKTHPCWGESVSANRPNMYFYNYEDPKNPPGTDPKALRIDTDSVLPGSAEEVTVQALLCVLDVVEDAAVPVQGCSTDPGTAVGLADGTYWMVTLLARGAADCDGETCNAEALVSEQVANFGAAGGGKSPAVPLTTRSNFPPSGSAEIVPNPNAGGVGVPISVWMPVDKTCEGSSSLIDPSGGSWATCEMHEWYGTDALPADYACPGNCMCELNESISNTKASQDVLGIDLVQDPEFPCDLFQFYFGVPRTSYQTVKGYSQIINDCDSLGPNSFGIYWVSGTECRINANTQVGSPDGPVMLISAAGLTKLNGGAEIYGTLFITDVEDSGAKLQSNGTNTIYGSAIIDGLLDSYQGTFQVVWNENTSRKAGADGGLGAVIGGWSDFHSDWE